MKFLGFVSLVSLFLISSARPWNNTPRGTSSLLINPAAQPDLPPLPPPSFAPDETALNLTNIQGDILVGMKKRKELFYFFSISDAAAFKKHLAGVVQPRITSTAALLDVSTQPVTAVNIAFSQSGLRRLNVGDSLDDDLFTAGQAADVSALGDPGTVNWIKAFAGTSIHGVLILASDTVSRINMELADLKRHLGNSIIEVHRLEGAARPGAQEGHEHFGYMDGIGQPAISGFTTNPEPGQVVIDPGNIIVGAIGDKARSAEWTKDGSFLVFRQLKQLVPEFNKFLADNPLKVKGLTTKEGSELLGARMVGRWKSGAPLMLSPLRDNPSFAGSNVNNNFDFDFTDADHPQLNLSNDQSRCPFSAHIRKTRPRADFQPEDKAHHIMRAGIPYGPEVTILEALLGTSIDLDALERGLAFVAYQSDIFQGFHLMQRFWANAPSFILGKNDSTPGFDPIVGANGGGERFVSGLDPSDSNRDIALIKDFVVSRGGEYFFTPSISALASTLAV